MKKMWMLNADSTEGSTTGSQFSKSNADKEEPSASRELASATKEESTFLVVLIQSFFDYPAFVQGFTSMIINQAKKPHQLPLDLHQEKSLLCIAKKRRVFQAKPKAIQAN
jgi:hypothetical protein